MEKFILLQHREAGAVLLQGPVKCADEQILERTKSVSCGFAKRMLTCTAGVEIKKRISLTKHENLPLKEGGVTS